MRIGDIEVEGLTYYPEAIDNEEENNLIKLCESLGFREITMRGMTARRPSCASVSTTSIEGVR